jgi:ABC-type glycerol-3-phosphate transport system permease component
MVLASLFKQLNRTGMLAAVAVWNTFVVAPLYVLSHKIGSSLPILSEQSLAIEFLVGNLLLAMVITAVSYLIVHMGIGRYQTRKIGA